MVIKILAVDDEVEILNALGAIFTTALQGYLFLTAMTANSGLSMIKEQKPDIVIVDVRLGPASGMDLISDYYTWIKSQKGGYNPVFIVITAYDDEGAKKKAEEFKVDAFLMKPFGKEIVLHAVVDGICKILHRELNNLDGLKNHYKKIADKAAEIGKKLSEGK